MFRILPFMKFVSELIQRIGFERYRLASLRALLDDAVELEYCLFRFFLRVDESEHLIPKIGGTHATIPSKLLLAQNL
jgi:hypothetical protein